MEGSGVIVSVSVTSGMGGSVLEASCRLFPPEKWADVVSCAGCSKTAVALSCP